MNALTSYIEGLLLRVDKEPQARYLFAALLPLFTMLLFPTSWIANEEDYLALAYRRVADAEFSEFSAVFDAANARFLFEYLMGGLIVAVGYESAHTLGRLGMAAVYAAAFAVFFRALGLSVLDALGAISLFCLAGQQLMGGEWLFNGVEGKTIAYAAVVAAIGYGWSGRWMLAVVLGACGTYFHFLAGGFWALSLGVLAYLRTRQPAAALRITGLVVALILPLAVVIFFDQLGSGPGFSGLNLDKIYAERVAHHVLPFASLWQLWSWTGGIVATGALAGTFWMLSRRAVQHDLVMFVLIMLIYLLTAVVVSFFDRHTYYLSKFYLFRPSSFTLLLAITAILLIFRRGEMDATLRLVRQLALGVLVTVFVWTTAKGKIEEWYFRTTEPLPFFGEIVATIEKASRPGEIVLIEAPWSDPAEEGAYPYVELPRKLPRPTLVSWKFAPSTAPGVERWHNMIEFRKNLFRDGCRARLEYPVRILMVFEQRTLATAKSCGTVIWESNRVTLIRVDDRWLARTPQGGSAADQRGE